MGKLFDITFSFLIFIYLMMGAHAWPLWFLEDRDSGSLMLLVKFIGSLFLFFYLLKKKIRLRKKREVLLGLLFLSVAGFHGLEGLNYFGIITLPLNLFLTIFPIWVILSIKDHINDLLKWIIKWISVIVALGIPLHIYIMSEGLIPGIPIYHPFTDLYYFFNYIILLEKPASILAGDIPRFQSIFLEPGYLAVLIVFLLYTIKFDLKKYKLAWILLVGLFFTLSLAGFIIGIAGFFLSRWAKKSHLITYIVVGLGLLMFFYAASLYNDGDNMINKRIVERLEFDQDSGIKGNNRVGNGTDFYFEKAIKSGDIWFGLGPVKIQRINGGKGSEALQDFENQIVGSGYKIFILYNGVFSLILYLLAYFFIGISNHCNRRYLWGFIILIFLTFIQAAYLDSYSWLIPFAIGVTRNSVQGANSLVIKRLK